MRRIQGVTLTKHGWRAELSCGHSDEAEARTIVGSFRFCAICKMWRLKSVAEAASQ